jgi:hypothetical protein
MTFSQRTLQIDARICESHADHTIATYRNVLVVIWHDRTTLEGVAAARRYSEELGKTHPEGVLYLVIVEAQAIVPNSKARIALTKLMNESQHCIACGVTLDGDGFRNAVVRGVATGLALVARQTFPFRVCSLDGACQLFAEAAIEAGTKVDSVGLPSVIARLRETIASSHQASTP